VKQVTVTLGLVEGKDGAVIKILEGGVTGYESFYLADYKPWPDGWCACAGTDGRWDTLVISKDDLASAINRLTIGDMARQLEEVRRAFEEFKQAVANASVMLTHFIKGYRDADYTNVICEGIIHLDNDAGIVLEEEASAEAKDIVTRLVAHGALVAEEDEQGTWYRWMDLP